MPPRWPAITIKRPDAPGMISHDDKTFGKSRLPPAATMIDAIACTGCREWPPPHNKSIVGIVGDDFQQTAIAAATNHDNAQSIIGDRRAINPFTLSGR